MLPVGYQLYSSRNFPSMEATLRMVGELGYAYVEGTNFMFDQPDLCTRLPQLLADNGLTMPTTHFTVDELETDAARVLKLVREMGASAIYPAWLEPAARPTDLAGWRSFGERLARIGKPYVDAGFIYGWHNHDYEFAAGDGSSLPIDAIFEGGPDLAWQIDVAWIVRGGADPLDHIDRYGSRIKSVHLKDIAPAGECEDEDGWADVGHGTMDWHVYLPALLKLGVDNFLVEHDNPADENRFARRSFESLKHLFASMQA